MVTSPRAADADGDRARPDARYDHVWRSRTHLLDRVGQRLRVVAIGTLNSALVEFSDGWTCVTTRFGYRRESVAVAADDASRASGGEGGASASG